MGLTQKLGTIPLAISTDASNNVGIGGSPSGSYKLEVTGTGRVSGNLLTGGYALIGTTSSTGVGASRLQVTGATAQLLVSNTTSSGHIALYTTGVDAYITKNTASGNMYFGLAPQDGSSFTSQMTITSAGYVGIGTSSPTAIGGYGGLTLSGTDGSFIDVRFNNTDSGRIYTNVNTAVGFECLNTNPIVFKTNSGSGATERMRITSAGNVGIGTTDPLREMVLYRASGEVHFKIANGTTGQGTTDGFDMAIDSSGGAYLINRENQPMYFLTNGTERMRITSDGNVGIGTSSPGEKLVVQGDNNNWTANIKGGATAGQSLGLLVTAGFNSSDYSFLVQKANSATIYFTVRGDGAIFFSPSYPFTTASGSNMWLDSSGVIQRNVSSIKYKTDVQDYDKGLTELMKLRPVSYLSKSEIDSPKRYAGMIAEELHELGFTEYVNLDENGEPDSISYASMVTILTKSIQEQQIQIQNLQEQINILAK